MRSLADVAAELGVSTSTVRNIEARALRKVRKNLEAQGLTLADFLPDVPTSEWDYLDDPLEGNDGQAD